MGGSRGVLVNPSIFNVKQVFNRCSTGVQTLSFHGSSRSQRVACQRCTPRGVRDSQSRVCTCLAQTPTASRVAMNTRAHSRRSTTHASRSRLTTTTTDTMGSDRWYPLALLVGVFAARAARSASEIFLCCVEPILYGASQCFNTMPGQVLNR